MAQLESDYWLGREGSMAMDNLFIGFDGIERPDPRKIGKTAKERQAIDAYDLRLWRTVLGGGK